MKKLFTVIAATFGLTAGLLAQGTIGSDEWYRFGAFSTNVQIMVGHASTNLTGNVLELMNGEDSPNIMVSFQSTNNAAADLGVTVNFVGSTDGTNYNTTPLYAATFPLNGTTLVIGSTNFGDAIKNIKFLKSTTTSTVGTTNGVRINWVRWGLFRPTAK